MVGNAPAPQSKAPEPPMDFDNLDIPFQEVIYINAALSVARVKNIHNFKFIELQKTV